MCEGRAADPQTPGYATRTRHRQMTGRVIGSEVIGYERAADYSVRHKSVKTAGKVTAKAVLRLMLTTACLGRLREDDLKRNVALSCSGDHDGGGKEAFQELSKQGDAHLNSPRRNAVPDHAQKMIVGDQI